MFNKSKAWAITLLVAVAVVGAVAGAAIQSWVAGRHAHRGQSPTYSEYLTRKLQLSAAQHDSVVAILRRHRPSLSRRTTKSFWCAA
ncbi:MAG TPA: periplasmic heavy metal sensor [Acetobacteraceae bacterium]|nr:periplasmic heavy metal sensor [Acetobacteraceae bacterium]